MKARFFAIFVPLSIVLSATFFILHAILMDQKSPGYPSINYYDANNIFGASIIGFICTGLIALLTLYIARLKKTVRDNTALTASLRNSEMHLNVLFNDAPDAYFLLDQNGTILNGNNAAAKMIGYSKEEAIGRTFAELKIMPEEQIPRALENLANTEEQHKNSPAEFTVLHRNGSVSEVEILRYPVMLDGSLKMLCMAHDITERKRRTLEIITSEAKYRSLIANIPNVTWTSDIHGNTIFISLNVTAITGFTQEEVYRLGSELWFGRIHPDDREGVIAAFQKLFEKGKPVSIEFRYKTKGGKWIWLQDKANSAYEKDGVMMADGVFIDITKRKETEEALKTNENLFRTIFDTSPDPIALSSLHNETYVNVNDKFAAFTGLKKEKIIGMPVKQLHLWKDINLRDSMTDKLGQHKESETFEVELIAHDGSIRTALMSARVVPIGGVNHMLTIAKDITDRKEYETELKKSAMIIDTTSDAVVGADTEGNITFWNTGAENIFGYSKDEALGRPISILYREEDLHILRTVVDNVMRGKLIHNVESLRIGKDGREIQTLLSVTTIKAKDGTIKELIGIFKDITERKSVETILRNLTDVIAADTGKPFFDSMTRHLASTLGVDYVLISKTTPSKPDYVETVAFCSKGTIIDNSTYDLCGSPGEMIAVNKLILHPSSVHELFPEHTILAEKTIEGYAGIALTGSNGNIIGMIELFSETPLHDIDLIETVITSCAVRTSAELERLNYQDELEVWGNIFTNAAWGVAVIDPAGECIRMINQGLASMHGYEAEELIGKPLSLLIDQSEEPKAANHTKSINENNSYKFETIAARKDGTSFPVYVSATAVKNKNDEVSYITLTAADMTEQKNLENQLRTSQRMEAIGQMTGGVAHDFNNILNAIMGFSSLIDMQMPADHPSKPHVAQIMKAAGRGAAVTKSLLSVGRRQIMNSINVDVNMIIRDLNKMLSRIIREDIEFTTNLSEESLTIMADPTHIEQILMNLVTNAGDAMPDGGYLLITTERFEITDKFIERHQYGIPGEYLLLSVADTGEGINKEDQEKIFEPFYTTKEIGKGTGLGLAIVYGIIKQHKGYIDVSSSKGHGTTFKIYFPLTNQADEQKHVNSYGGILAGSETILVAEDDTILRALIKEILESQGYTVLLTENGKAAVDIFNRQKNEIQLLIFDVIMPIMNGKEAYKEIIKIKPGMKTIFLSGYASNMIDQSDLKSESVTFLEKPVNAQKLLESVRLALEETMQGELL